MLPRIILASKSPRRQDLLKSALINFEVIAQDTEENYPTGLPIEKVPEYLALEKALAVLNSEKYISVSPSRIPILAADTIVCLNDEIIGKPKDRNDAIETLLKLSGKEHVVITGVVILFHDRQISFSEKTYVTFHKLKEKQVIYYVDRFQPYDKAGSYAIQEWIGVVGIESIRGDYYNVMGLPVSKVVKILEDL